MSQVNIELHKKYANEHITGSEYEVVHQEMAAIGFLRIASTNNVTQHLPRACYFNPNGTRLEVEQAWKNIKRRLMREVSIEMTFGTSFGLGLKPISNFINSPLSIKIFSALSSVPAIPYSSLFGISGSSSNDWEQPFSSLALDGKTR